MFQRRKQRVSTHGDHCLGQEHTYAHNRGPAHAPRKRQSANHDSNIFSKCLIQAKNAFHAGDDSVGFGLQVIESVLLLDRGREKSPCSFSFASNKRKGRKIRLILFLVSMVTRKLSIWY